MTMWLAAFAGRLAYFTHRANGHTVTWNVSSTPPAACAGDIVCHECGQVLWCRAHDPWRASTPEPAPDHWGGAQARDDERTLFDSLQHVLRLAAACPPGVAGDEIRRFACRLVEADSVQERTVCRRRLLKYVVRVQGRDRSRTGAAAVPVVFGRLAEALRGELWDG